MEYMTELTTFIKLFDLNDNSRISLAIKLALSFIIIVISISNISKIIGNIFKKLPKAKIERFSGIPQETMKSQCLADKAIDNILKCVLDKYHSVSRITVAQFHNGIKFKSGVPFEKITFTNEVCDPGIAVSCLKTRGDFEMLLFSEIILNIIDGKSFCAKISELDHSLQLIFGKDGVLSIMVHVILNPYDETRVTGMVIFQNVHSEHFPESDNPLCIEEDLCDAAHKISGIFEATRLQEKPKV